MPEMAKIELDGLAQAVDVLVVFAKHIDL